MKKLLIGVLLTFGYATLAQQTTIPNAPGVENIASGQLPENPTKHSQGTHVYHNDSLTGRMSGQRSKKVSQQTVAQPSSNDANNYKEKHVPVKKKEEVIGVENKETVITK